MKRSQLISIVLSIVFLFIIFFVYRKLSAPSETRDIDTAIQQKILRIKTDTIYAKDVPMRIRSQGRLVSTSKIQLFSEVNGQMTQGTHPFKDGVYFKKGEVLLNIDNRELDFNIKAAKSSLLSTITSIMPDLKIDYPEDYQRWLNYIDDFDENMALEVLPMVENTQAKYLINSKNIYNQYYTIKSQEIRLNKHRVIAPFNGILTNVQINPGGIVRAGQLLASFSNPQSLELRVAISLQESGNLKRGQDVRIISDDMDRTWTGKIIRLGQEIEESTQSITVYIAVSGGQLWEGMFVTAEILSKNMRNVLAIEKNRILEGKVFICHDEQLNEVDAQVAFVDRDTAYMLTKDRYLVLPSRNIRSAYDGMPVKVLQ